MIKSIMNRIISVIIISSLMFKILVGWTYYDITKEHLLVFRLTNAFGIGIHGGQDNTHQFKHRPN